MFIYIQKNCNPSQKAMQIFFKTKKYQKTVDAYNWKMFSISARINENPSNILNISEYPAKILSL